MRCVVVMGVETAGVGKGAASVAATGNRDACSELGCSACLFLPNNQLNMAALGWYLYFVGQNVVYSTITVCSKSVCLLQCENSSSIRVASCDRVMPKWGFGGPAYNWRGGQNALKLAIR